MMATTHAAIGVVSFAGVAAMAGVPPAPAALAASAVGAWLPDVDTPTSKAGFCVYPLAQWLERCFGHRTITHSAVGVLVFAALCAPLLMWPHFRPYFWPLLVGYVSHLLADAATKSGVPLAWPNRARYVFPGNEQLRVKTGSMAEIGVLVVTLGVGLLLVPLQNLGARRLLHLATGTQAGAVRDVEDWNEKYFCEAEVEGFDVLNGKLVSGRFPVIGRREDGTILIERNAAYWMVKETGTELHRITPRRIRIFKLGPRNDEVVSLRVANVSFAALNRSLLVTITERDGFNTNDILITGSGECHPFPQDAGSTPMDAPAFGMKTVVFSGQKVAFDFAQLRHLTQASPHIVLKSATLTVRLPKGAQRTNLNLPLQRAEVLCGSMRRHADLMVRVGDLVRRGQSLTRTFAQQLEHEPTPQEQEAEARAEAARKELAALEVEESAMRRSTLWPQLQSGFTARRRVLDAQANWSPPTPPKVLAPPSTRVPFDAVVESTEWEPPTIPTRKGEVAEHAARVSLIKVLW
jgi:membrane-bound metal-dependent hydrolase YbcI (DUF457 family)